MSWRLLWVVSLLAATTPLLALAQTTGPRVTSFQANCVSPCLDPATIRLAATVSATAPNTLAKVEFFRVGESVALASFTSSAPNCNWTQVPPGSYALQVVVTDSQGLQASASAAPVTVRHTPRIRLVAPASGATVAKGVPTVLSALVTDPDQIGLDNVVFKNASGSWIGGASTPNNGAYTTSYTFNTLGAASVTAIAYNRLGTNASSATVLVQVGNGASPPPAAGPYAYLSNSSANSLSVIDTGSDAVRATVPTGPGPKGLAVSSDARRVYVALSGSKALAIYDAQSLELLQTLLLPAPPLALALAPDGSRAYVTADAADQLYVLDLTAGTIAARVPVGRQPQGVAVAADGTRVIVANSADASLSVIDSASFSTATWPLPAGSQPGAVALSRDGSRAYVSGQGSNSLYIVDGANGALLQTLPIGPRPFGVALNPDETAAYVANYSGSGNGSVAKVELASGTITTTALPAGAYPLGLAVHPDGSRVYVAGYSKGKLYVLDAASAALGASLTVGNGPYALGPFIALPQAVLSLDEPPPGAMLRNASPSFRYSYQTQCNGAPCQLAANYDSGYRLTQLINGSAWPGSDSVGGGSATWQPLAALPEGAGSFAAWLVDRFGGRSNAVGGSFTIDTLAPRFLSISPPSGSVLFAPNTQLSGSVDDASATITLGGAAPQSGPNFSFPLTLHSGLNSQSLVAADPASNSSTAVVNLSYAAFALSISAPEDGASVATPTVTVRGRFSNATSASIAVNGLAASLNGQEFSADVPLALGPNTLTVTATRGDDGQVVTQTRQVTRISGNQAPTLTLSAPQNLVLPNIASLQATGSDDGMPSPPAALSYLWVQESGPTEAWIANRKQAATTVHFVKAGVYVFRATVSDGEHSASATTQVTVSEPALPPDPATVAPPIDPLRPALPGITATFLYTGPNPIQTGVNPETIDPKRAAVMRGKLLSRDGQPLSGATVTVHRHPEFGQTLSRADGMFDLVVNGGGTLTLNFEKPGYLPVQRQLNVAWMAFASVKPVVLIPLSESSAQIAMGANSSQLARGDLMTDERGSRSATMYFASGTTANMVNADGTVVALDTLHVRSTEYTVGPKGPLSLPGALPPTSAYTYAVELSADEAYFANARRIEFSKPVAVYVHNFVGFPVGGPVPVGWYDRGSASWVPSADGRVVRVMAIENGTASLDVDGSGMQATGELLAELGLGADELTRLAEIFSVGESFWRFQMSHFTPADCNWPHDVPPDAEPPRQPPPADEDPKEDCDDCPGSTVLVQNRVLGERIGILGTRHALSYRSDRVPGRGKGLTIQLSGPRVPASLKEIVLTIEIAWRQYYLRFPPLPDQKYYFEWDGLDVYGREAIGGQYLEVLIEHVYPSFYCWPRNYIRSGTQSSQAEFGDAISQKAVYSRFIPSFRESCVEPIIPYRWTVDAALEQYSYARPGSTRPLEHLDQRVHGFGGWGLDGHKVFDPISRVLRDGSGAVRSVSTPRNRAVIRTHAGNGDFQASPSDDGKPARESAATPSAIARATDGTVYFAEAVNQTVRAVGPDGILRTVAGIPRVSGGEGADTTFGGGSGTSYIGSGGPDLVAKPHKRVLATQVEIEPTALALGHDGSLYIADRRTHTVLRVDRDGAITTFAGNGVQGYGGDGGPATLASLNGDYLRSLAVTSDGGLLILDRRRVRRVGADGMIATVVGSGNEPPTGDFGEPGVDNGDGGRAALAGLSLAASAIAVGPDDDIYIADWQRVRRVDAFGTIRTVAGKWGYQEPRSGDGGSSTDATLLASSIAVARDGTLFIGDTWGKSVRMVAPGGVISTLLGTKQGWLPFVEGGTGSGQSTQPSSLAVGPDGYLYVADDAHHRIVRVEPALPGFTAGDFDLASADGNELYRFDGDGRHVQTLNSRTGAPVHTFAYSKGLVEEIRDGDGASTRIERDFAGRPLAIVSPDGQRTSLSLDQSGWLSSVTNSAGESHRMNHTPTGLLTRFETPTRYASTFAYDAAGRLVKDENAAGGFWFLNETIEPSGRSIEFDSAEGRSRTYRLENLPTGDERRSNTAADGTVTLTEIGADASTTTTTADGTISKVTKGPDPRFGMQAPINAEVRTTLPSGLTSITQTSVSANLADANNPLSLIDETTTRTRNGRSSVSTYDAAARQYTNTTAAGRVSTLAVDAQGRPTRSEVAGVAAVHYAYDTRGRLVGITQGEGPQARQLSFAYGTDGLVQSVTDALTRQVIYQRDAAGRVTQAALPGERNLTFAYDPNGNVTGISPPGRPEHAFQYTPVDLPAEYQPPPAGLPLAKTQYTYNRDKQLSAVLYPDGTSLALHYDSAGRLVTLTPSTGAGQAVSYGYSASTGQLTSLANAEVSLAYGYDGSLRTLEHFTGAVNGSLTRSHDADFRVSGLALNGDNIALSYDPDGLLTQAGELQFIRDPANGLIRGTTLGSVHTTQAYDTFGEQSAFSASHNATALYAYTLAYDALGRIIGKTETLAGVTTSYQYAYDTAGRLETVTQDGSLIRSYGYDANGNRSTVNGSPVASYDEQDRLLAYEGKTYGYTARGTLTQKTEGTQSTQYQYDAFGNLATVTLPEGTAIEYLVDGKNRRVGKKVDGVPAKGYLYQSQLRIAAELDGSGNLVSRYVYGSKVNVPEYMVKNGQTYRLLTDHLGSVRLVVNATSGEVVQRMDYDEFGQVLTDTHPGFQPFGFAGGLYDAQTKLVRFGARDYDAETGRWTAKDPIGFRGGDANIYSYVRGNPSSYKDAKGLLIQCKSGMRSLKGMIVGPLHHQFTCFGTKDGSIACRGFGRDPNSDAADAIFDIVPGVVLKDVENYATSDDLFQDNVCAPDDNNECMDDCVGGLYADMEKNPPPYSWTKDGATQCKAANEDIVNTCKQKCGVK